MKLSQIERNLKILSKEFQVYLAYSLLIDDRTIKNDDFQNQNKNYRPVEPIKLDFRVSLSSVFHSVIQSCTK